MFCFDGFSATVHQVRSWIIQKDPAGFSGKKTGQMVMASLICRLVADLWEYTVHKLVSFQFALL